MRNVVGGFGETATDQHRGDMGLLLHPIGERHIGGRGVADIEHQIGRQPHDIFEIDRVAATGEPAELRQLGISSPAEMGCASGLGARVQPSIFSGASRVEGDRGRRPGGKHPPHLVRDIDPSTGGIGERPRLGERRRKSQPGDRAGA